MKVKPTSNAAARQPKTKAVNFNHIEDAAADAMSTIAALTALVMQLAAKLEKRDEN